MLRAYDRGEELEVEKVGERVDGVTRVKEDGGWWKEGRRADDGTKKERGRLRPVQIAMESDSEGRRSSNIGNRSGTRLIALWTF